MKRLDSTNPAHHLVALGLLRFGYRGGWRFGDQPGFDLDGEISAAQIADEAQQFARGMAAAIDEEVGDVTSASWQRFAAIGGAWAREASGLGAANRDEGFAHSRWQMVSGPQKWLPLVIKAASMVNQRTASEWLEAVANHGPPLGGITPLGLNPAAREEPARSAFGRTSREHPCTLFLAALGALQYPVTMTEDGAKTPGWLWHPSRVRWVLWDGFVSLDTAMAMQVNGWASVEAQDLIAIEGEMGMIDRVKASTLWRREGWRVCESQLLHLSRYYWGLSRGKEVGS